MLLTSSVTSVGRRFNQESASDRLTCGLATQLLVPDAQWYISAQGPFAVGNRKGRILVTSLETKQCDKRIRLIGRVA